MKRILFVLLMLIAARMSGQNEFAPVGAEWHYNYNFFWTSGYVLIESVSDTIIDNIECRKLSKSIAQYDQIQDKIYEGIFGYEYMTQINDSVMIYVDGVFKKLYDFSAEIGDTIIIPALEHHEEYTYGTAVVTGKGVMEFEGDSLKYIDLKQPEDWEDSPWKFSCYHDYSNDYYNTVRICEKIGNISGYLLPEKCFIADDEEGGALRCYSDEELNVKFSDEECDYVPHKDNVNEISASDMVKIYPNPANDKISIELTEENNTIDTYDNIGRKISSFQTNNKIINIDISEYPSGLYLIVIKNINESIYQRIIKK